MIIYLQTFQYSLIFKPQNNMLIIVFYIFYNGCNSIYNYPSEISKTIIKDNNKIIIKKHYSQDIGGSTTTPENKDNLVIFSKQYIS